MEGLNSFSLVMLGLISLRSTDNNAFMEKLYTAVTVDYRESLLKSDLTEIQSSFGFLLNYFEKKEDYEKCAQLYKLFIK